MKRIHGSARREVSASSADCLRILDAIEEYPSWHPDVVRAVTVRERDDRGRAIMASATLRVTRGPFGSNLELMLAIDRQHPHGLRLTRLPNEPGDNEEFDANWSVVEHGEQTTIELDLRANLDVPRVVPIGGLGDQMAEGFVAAASERIERDGHP